MTPRLDGWVGQMAGVHSVAEHDPEAVLFSIVEIDSCVGEDVRTSSLHDDPFQRRIRFHATVT